MVVNLNVVVNRIDYFFAGIVVVMDGYQDFSVDFLALIIKIYHYVVAIPVHVQVLKSAIKRMDIAFNYHVIHQDDY